MYLYDYLLTLDDEVRVDLYHLISDFGPSSNYLDRLNTPGEARKHGVRIRRSFFSPFRMSLTVDNSFLPVHPGEHSLRTVFINCLSANTEQVRPNVLPGMGIHRFVAKISRSTTGGRLTFDDPSHQPKVPPISKSTQAVIIPRIATDSLCHSCEYSKTPTFKAPTIPQVQAHIDHCPRLFRLGDVHRPSISNRSVSPNRSTRRVGPEKTGFRKYLRADTEKPHGHRVFRHPHDSTSYSRRGFSSVSR